MREIRQSGSEGGVAHTRHPYPYVSMVRGEERRTLNGGTFFWWWMVGLDPTLSGLVWSWGGVFQGRAVTGPTLR